MAKMIIGIVVVVLGLYAAWFVRLGNLTFKEHVVRIAHTPEVHDLGSGIADAVGTAKDTVKLKIASRLHQTRDVRVDRDAPTPDIHELDPDELDRRHRR